MEQATKSSITVSLAQAQKLLQKVKRELKCETNVNQKHRNMGYYVDDQSNVGATTVDVNKHLAHSDTFEEFRDKCLAERDRLVQEFTLKNHLEEAKNTLKNAIIRRNGELHQDTLLSAIEYSTGLRKDYKKFVVPDSLTEEDLEKCFNKYQSTEVNEFTNKPTFNGLRVFPADAVTSRIKQLNRSILHMEGKRDAFNASNNVSVELYADVLEVLGFEVDSDSTNETNDE